MARLKTLKPRLAAANTQRVKPLLTTERRLTGYARQNLKRLIYSRDGGRCCLCKRAVELGESELDHRVALQFGGDNSTDNLWTLCRPCHASKSAREAASQLPDLEALAVDVTPDPGDDRYFVV